MTRIARLTAAGAPAVAVIGITIGARRSGALAPGPAANFTGDATAAAHLVHTTLPFLV